MNIKEMIRVMYSPRVHDLFNFFDESGKKIKWNIWHVLPLSFSEYYGFVGGSKEEAFDDYSLYGGLPQAVLMKTDEQKTQYLIGEMKSLFAGIATVPAIETVVAGVGSIASAVTYMRDKENNTASSMGTYIRNSGTASLITAFVIGTFWAAPYAGGLCP